MDSKDNIRCGLINIQSVSNKTIEIRELITDYKLDICVLTETWLQGNLSDASKIKEMTPDTHVFYNAPRKDKRGGGVGVVMTRIFSRITM